MKRKSDNRIEDLLSDINEQQKFSEAKNEIPKENVVDGAAVGVYISQYAEIEA